MPSELPSSFSSFSRETAKALRGERNKSKFVEMISLPGIMDSSMKSFSYSFCSVLPQDVKSKFAELEGNSDAFREYIEKTLQPATKPLVAIEFGGPGSKLFKDFTPGFFVQTLGVCLTDTRESSTKREDEMRNHNVLMGNIFSASTYGNIRRTIEGDREVGLIISRMMGPLHSMTRNPNILAKVVRTWYGLLSHTPGLLFVQFPQSDDLYGMIKDWAGYIQKNYGTSLEIEVGQETFRLFKKPGAPKDLPLLKSADVSAFDDRPTREDFLI